MDENIDQKIFDLFPAATTYTGITWEEIRTKIPDPDSHIASRLKHLQTSGKIEPVVVYVMKSDANQYSAT